MKDLLDHDSPQIHEVLDIQFVKSIFKLTVWTKLEERRETASMLQVDTKKSIKWVQTIIYT